MLCAGMEWWTDEQIKRESFEIFIQEINEKYA